MVGRGFAPAVLLPYFFVYCVSKPICLQISRPTNWRLFLCKTNNTLNAVQDSKRYKNRSKTGIVKAKYISPSLMYI